MPDGGGPRCCHGPHGHRHPARAPQEAAAGIAPDGPHGEGLALCPQRPMQSLSSGVHVKYRRLMFFDLALLYRACRSSHACPCRALNRAPRTAAATAACRGCSAPGGATATPATQGAATAPAAGWAARWRRRCPARWSASHGVGHWGLGRMRIQRAPTNSQCNPFSLQNSATERHVRPNCSCVFDAPYRSRAMTRRSITPDAAAPTGRRPSSSAAPRTSSRAPSHTGSRGTDDEQSTPSHGHGLQAAGRRSKLGLLVPSRHSSHGTLPVGGVGPPPQQQPDDAGPAPMLGYIASPSAAASLTRGRSGGAGAGRHWAADRTEALRTGTDGGARGGTSVGVGGACAVTPRSPSSPAAGRARLCEACGGALGAGATEGGAAGVARQRRRWSNTNNNTGSSKLGVRQCACGGKARGHRSAVGGDGRLGAGTPAAGGVRTLSSGSLGWPEGAEEGGRHGGAGDNATVVSPRTTGAEQTFMDDLRQLSTTSSLAPPPGPLGQPAPPHLWAAGAAEGTPVAAAALGGLPRTGSATGRDLEFLVVGAQGPLSHHPSSTLSRNQSLAARPDRLHGQSGGGSRTSFEHSMEHPWPGEDHAHPHAFARRASGLGPHGRPHAALQINVLGLQPHGGSGSPRAPSSSRGGSHGGLQGPTSPLVLRGLGSGTPRALGSPQGGGGRGSPYPLSQGAGAGGGGGAIVPADSTLRSWAHIPHPPSHALSHVSSGVPVAWGDGADGLSTVDEVRAAGGALSPPRAAGKDSAKQRGGKLSAGSGGPSAGGAAAEVPSSPSHAAGGGALPRFVRALAGWAGGGGGEAVSEGGAGAGSPGGGRGNAKDQQQQQQQKVVGLQKVLRERLSSPGIGTAAGARAGTAVPLANVTEDAASGSPFYGSKAAPRSAR